MGSTLVIMAAGIGSRYGGLKQLEPVGPGGETMIDYAVYDAARAGFVKTVFVVRPEIKEEFDSVLGRRLSSLLEIAYVFQEMPAVEGRKKPWGTGEAILKCREAVDGPFGIVNADDFYGAESYRVLNEYLVESAQEAIDYCLVGFKLEETLSIHGPVARGVCGVDAAGFLKKVTECTGVERSESGVRTNELGELTGKERASMNMWGFKPSLFDELDMRFKEFLKNNRNDRKAEFYLPPVVGNMVEKDRARARVLPTSSRYFGVTYRDDRPDVAAEIRKLVERGEYPENLTG